jgi:hypothetical protein
MSAKGSTAIDEPDTDAKLWAGSTDRTAHQPAAASAIALPSTPAMSTGCGPERSPPGR